MDQHGGYFPSYKTLILLFITILSPVRGQWYRPSCWIQECCSEKWIPRDYEGVKKDLHANLFGQPLVQSVVYASLKGHVKYQPQKPLVLSFHGSTGVGKTFVSQWIAKNWFRKGMQSTFVHFFSGTRDFPWESEINSYMTFLQGQIYSHTYSCQHQLFIFDEIDSFPPRLLNAVRSCLEYYGKADGVDYRNTIFIFLSKTGNAALKRIAENAYRNNSTKSLQLAKTERAMISEIFNTNDTGLRLNRLIDRHLISHFVPFLPLERRHVKQCITRELKGMLLQENSKMVDEVMKELQFGGLDNNFSLKGCKNVDEKVKYVISKILFEIKDEL